MINLHKQLQLRGHNYSLEELEEWKEIASSPLSYKYMTIKKPDGKKRYLQAPDEPLKRLQRAIIDCIGPMIRPYVSYGVYKPVSPRHIRRDWVENGRWHWGRRVIVKMDIKEFFPSTTVTKYINGIYSLDIISHREEHQILEKTLEEIVDLVFIKPSIALPYLPTGAPTSPIVSDIAFKPVDVAIVRYLNAFREQTIYYSRYVDDLTFSMCSYPKGFQRIINEIASMHHWKLNHKKSQLLYTGQDKAIVTGINMQSPCGVNKKERGKLRAMLHQYALSGKPLDSVAQGRLQLIRRSNLTMYQGLLNYYDKTREKYESQRK